MPLLVFSKAETCAFAVLSCAAFAVACGRGPSGTKPAPSAAASVVPSARAVLPPGGGDPARVARGQRAERRAACYYGPGARPRDTLDLDAPEAGQIPLDHFVVVMQENRSFDHYFQKLPQFGQTDVDVAPASYANADPSGEGAIVHPFLAETPCYEDVPHNWVAVHHQIADGKMNGFLAAANPDGRRALSYYDQSTLGYYYALASTFAMGDRYFAAVPGPTFPNRMFALSASSFGHVANTPPPPRDEERTLFHQLEAKGLSWVIYAQGRTFEEQMYPRLHAEKGEHFRDFEEFFTDAASGKLPFFAWIESIYDERVGTDEHAPGDVQLGQAFVARVVKAFMASPTWPSSALILNYDEHGGFFDHVPPPRACPPDDEPPHTETLPENSSFDRLGVRVPFVVVSPFARPHFVSHRTYTHTSVLRLVQAKADLPALTRRDANDAPPFDMFDFREPSFPSPPILPEATVDEAARKRCLREESEPRRK
ncbi:MAG TPA: alkaline phosphatase family protein [Polyangiaceae bacterium]|nr:alkaline phosphatase family protein [Polyangiaceae bacterium]